MLRMIVKIATTWTVPRANDEECLQQGQSVSARERSEWLAAFVLIQALRSKMQLQPRSDLTSEERSESAALKCP